MMIAYHQHPDAKISQREPKPEPVLQIGIPHPTVAKTLSLDGPHFSEDEIGLTEPRKAHSEADGHGVRATVADGGNS